MLVYRLSCKNNHRLQEPKNQNLNGLQKYQLIALKVEWPFNYMKYFSLKSWDSRFFRTILVEYKNPFFTYIIYLDTFLTRLYPCSVTWKLLPGLLMVLINQSIIWRIYKKFCFFLLSQSAISKSYHNWVLSNCITLVNLEPSTPNHVRFLLTVLLSITWTSFMSKWFMIQKIYSKMLFTLRTKTYHDFL